MCGIDVIHPSCVHVEEVCQERKKMYKTDYCAVQEEERAARVIKASSGGRE